MVAIGATLGGAFAAVYFTTMSTWGTGEASFEPFRVLQITEFWKTSAGHLVQLLSPWMPADVAGKLANAACALVVIAGTSGVRLLAIAYFVHPDPRHRHTISPWLAAVFLAACAMGLMLHLDSYGELYLILLIRLPMAVLAAAFLVSGAEHLAACWRAVRVRAGERSAIAPGRLGPALRGGIGVLFGGFAAAGLALTLVAQCGLWVARNRTGLDAWLRHSPHQRITDEMLSLLEAMRWIRESTEPNAVLVANAFTAGNLKEGRGIVVDHTTAGVHYYYSAFSGRRLYVEGPTYLLDRPRVQRRMQRAAELFYRGALPEFAVAPASPFYAIIDRTLNDGASIALPADFRVFENARYEIYRLPPDLPGRSERTPLAALKHE